MKPHFIVFVSVVFGLICVQSFGQNQWTIDSTFGINGVINADTGAVKAITRDNYGNILVVGSKFTGSIYEIIVYKYDPNGSLDASFGDNGSVTITHGGLYNIGYSIKVQPDDKILIGGYSQSSSAKFYTLTRLNENGTLDSSFGNNGKIRISNIYAYFLSPVALSLQSDSKIVFCATSRIDTISNLWGVIIVRYLPNGAIDSTYGTAGIVKIIYQLPLDFNSLIVKESNKIVIASIQDDNNIFVMHGINPDGSIDNTFGDNGIIQLAKEEADNPYIAYQNDKLILLGQVRHLWRLVFYLTRFNDDGTVDNTFGDQGEYFLHIGSSDSRPAAIIIGPDDKIFIAGHQYVTNEDPIILAAFNNNGWLDLTFGNNGYFSSVIPGYNLMARDVLLLEDNQLITLGELQLSASVSKVVLLKHSFLETSISEIPNTLSISISPNPATSYFNLQTNTRNKLQIQIFDAVGKLMVEKSLAGDLQYLVNLRSLSNGLYYVRIVQNYNSITKKLVINN